MKVLPTAYLSIVIIRRPLRRFGGNVNAVAVSLNHAFRYRAVEKSGGARVTEGVVSGEVN